MLPQIAPVSEQAAMETSLIHEYLVQFWEKKREKKAPSAESIGVDLTSLCLVLVFVGIVC